MPELKPEISSADFNFLLDFSQTPEISSSNFLVKTPRQLGRVLSAIPCSFGATAADGS